MVLELTSATYGIDAVRALILDENVITVVDVTVFGGIYDTLVPALAVLAALNIVFGAVAVTLLSRASTSKAD